MINEISIEISIHECTSLPDCSCYLVLQNCIIDNIVATKYIHCTCIPNRLYRRETTKEILVVVDICVIVDHT